MSVLRKGMRLVGQGAEVLMANKGPRLTEDDSPAEREEVLRRKMRELRTRERKFETVICQVDRSTGEIIIPKKTRGMIAALKREAEHRMLGWIAAGTLAVFMVAGWSRGDQTTRPALQARAVTGVEAGDESRSRGYRDRSRALPVATETRVVTVTETVPVYVERVKVGSRLQHRVTGSGTIVLYADDVYETRPVTVRTAQATPAPADTRVNLNTATLEELDAKLDGVGPAMARKIIAARPFRSVEDLDNVSGIGPRRMAALRPLVTVD